MLDGDLCKNLFDLLIFFFRVFNHDFIIYIDFTRIAASNAATDDVTNYITHRVFSTKNIIFFG